MKGPKFKLGDIVGIGNPTERGITHFIDPDETAEHIGLIGVITDVVKEEFGGYGYQVHTDHPDDNREPTEDDLEDPDFNPQYVKGWYYPDDMLVLEDTSMESIVGLVNRIKVAENSPTGYITCKKISPQLGAVLSARRKLGTAFPTRWILDIIYAEMVRSGADTISEEIESCIDFAERQIKELERGA